MHDDEDTELVNMEMKQEGLTIKHIQLLQDENIASVLNQKVSKKLSLTTQKISGTLKSQKTRESIKRPEEEVKKKKDSAMRDTENSIMEFITKANYMLELIEMCTHAKDLEAFFAEIKTKEEQKQKVMTKLGTVLEYLS